ncbi:hypothetical protein L1049_016118 [Liquidambar formosana]|uniref:Retrotransposon gag domain-containing protein n=1 Tax=Liquidambar formosana TaxID=63359 RepID=A0AAP0X708_LIQFO
MSHEAHPSICSQHPTALQRFDLGGVRTDWRVRGFPSRRQCMIDHPYPSSWPENGHREVCFLSIVCCVIFFCSHSRISGIRAVDSRLVKYEQGETSQSGAGVNSHTHQATYTRYAKIDFPKFFGDNPTGWLYKCERFFDFNQIEESQKVKIAAIHLEDKGLKWFQWFEKTNHRINWRDFSTALKNRFDPNVYEDAVGELTKLNQESNVQIYQEKFEELANRTSGLPEEFFVSCFISGLKEEIKAGVQMFKPTNMVETIGLAKLQEASIEAITKKARLPIRNKFSSPLT